MNNSCERHLYYSDKSNEPVDNLRFNKHIVSIRLGKKFNHPVEELPINLETLTIESDNFNYSLDYLPKKVKKLRVWGIFNLPIDNLPTSLEHLSIGQFFNKSVDNLPHNLKELYLGRDFNKPVNKLPPNLQFLSLNVFFNQSLDKLPSKLENLWILNSNYIIRSSNFSFNNLPEGLKSLRINYLENYQKLNNLPADLEEIILGISHDDKIENLPVNLKRLVANKKCMYNTKIPFNCEVVQIGE